MENKKWYINQKVWDKTVSDEDSGKIIHISDGEIFPITVEFKECNRTYTVDGRNSLFCVPTLSTKPYEIIMEGFSQEVEEVEEKLPKKGQVCWGKGEYLKGFHVGHFIEKVDGIYKLSSSNDIEEGFFSCNEITTKNPYAVEEEVSILETTDREPKVGDMCFFWDDEEPKGFYYGKLELIRKGIVIVYGVDDLEWDYCSLKNPLIK